MDRMVKKNDWLSKSKAVKNFKTSKLKKIFDSFTLAQPIIFFNHSIKDSDWLIVACFMRV